MASKAAEREINNREEAASAFVVEKALKTRSIPPLDVIIFKRDGEKVRESV